MKKLKLQVIEKPKRIKLKTTNRPKLTAISLPKFDVPKIKLKSIDEDIVIAIISNSDCYFSGSGSFSKSSLNEDIYYILTDKMKEYWINFIETRNKNLIKIEAIKHYAIIHTKGLVAPGFLIFEDKYGRTYKKQETDIDTEETRKSILPTKNGTRIKTKGRKKIKKS